MQFCGFDAVKTIGFGLALVIGFVSATGGAAADDKVGVLVANTSKPIRCAEADNVTLRFRSNKVRRFRIQASHPSYLASLRRDNWNADWTGCDFGPQAKAQTKSQKADAAPRPVRKTERVTLYEEPAQWLVGWRFPTFWRPATASVRVGKRVEQGLHLLQLWRIRPNGGEEVLVLYPQDGYWRVRPPAPRGRDLTAFGSSFLVGPIEFDGRPIVRLKEIVYEPGAQRFSLQFARGGMGTVRIVQLDARGIALDVAFDHPISGRPFAALRSMFVTETNNDVARVAIRTPRGVGWHEAGVMAFKGGEVVELWAGRTVPSRHNTSAPDMVFKAFRAGAKP